MRGWPTHRQYSEQILDHYRHPRNVGDLPGADAVATVGNPGHGDVLRLSLRIAEGRVAEARFKVFGCAVAIAAGSVTTELIRDRPLEDLEVFSNSEVSRALGGVPEEKLACSVMAEQALREALRSLRGRSAGGRDEERVLEPFRGTAASSAAGPTPRKYISSPSAEGTASGEQREEA